MGGRDSSICPVYLLPPRVCSGRKLAQKQDRICAQLWDVSIPAGILNYISIACPGTYIILLTPLAWAPTEKVRSNMMTDLAAISHSSAKWRPEDTPS